MSPALTRRAVVAGAGAALGAAALPAGRVCATVARTPPTGIPAPFDAAAYVADLEAIGCRLAAWQPSRGGGSWSYMVGSPRGRGFGQAHLEVMRRWSAAIEACPDHGRRVAAVLLARDGAVT